MKTMFGALAAAAFALVQPAQAREIHCDIGSDYGWRVQPERLVLNRKSPAKEVVIDHGEVRVDGRALDLDPATQARVAAYEREVRALVPDAKALARDAVEIAFDAIAQVGATFASDPAEARASAQRIARSGHELAARIEQSDSFDEWNDDRVDRALAEAISTLIPDLVGNVTAQALKAAFSGDAGAAAELQARADSIEKSVDQAVRKRAVALEARADALCRRAQALERSQAALGVRLPDGSALLPLRTK